jgi:hypothetical protein
MNKRLLAVGMLSVMLACLGMGCGSSENKQPVLKDTNLQLQERPAPGAPGGGKTKSSGGAGVQ